VADTDRAARVPDRAFATRIVLGGVCGLAWAAGLRGFMAEVAGPKSGIEWAGTFLFVLLPGVVTGVLLGWAEHIRTTGGRRWWRWLACSPLVFSSVLVGPLLQTGSVVQSGGIGGGALAVPLFGMAGGFAISGRGPAWARIVCGLITLAPIPVWAMVAALVGGPGLALDTARGAWVALYFWSYLAVLAAGCAIPHRPVVDRQGRR
jgi:hypothetical protein